MIQFYNKLNNLDFNSRFGKRMFNYSEEIESEEQEVHH